MGDPNDTLPTDDDLGPDSAPPSSNFDGEDFLFHLYRGSELLQDNCIAEAKEELERALSMQPKDAEGQALLGVVYFRLGLYPRAIGIYEDLLRTFPAEVTPRMNLAVCYLKTGQSAEARQMLEEVVSRAPDHRRAWGYLGLVFERTGDYGKAQAAFERAGQTGMAKRMQERLPGREAIAPTDSAHEDVRRAAADAVREIELDPSPFSHAEFEPRSASDKSADVGRWQAREPGRRDSEPPPAPSPAPISAAPGPPSSPPAAPPTLVPPSDHPGPTPTTLAAQHALPLPEQGVVISGDRLAIVRVRESLTVRTAAVRALLPEKKAFEASPAYRRMRGNQLDEPLGGVDAALGHLAGAGRVVLGATKPESHLAAIVVVPDELLYVREDLLIGFEGSLRHESGRLAGEETAQYPMVQFAGEGAVILELAGRLHAVPVGPEDSITVAASSVVGWTGRLFPRPRAGDAPAGGRGFVGFTGVGSLFLMLD